MSKILEIRESIEKLSKIRDWAHLHTADPFELVGDMLGSVDPDCDKEYVEDMVLHDLEATLYQIMLMASPEDEHEENDD